MMKIVKSGFLEIETKSEQITISYLATHQPALEDEPGGYQIHYDVINPITGNVLGEWSDYLNEFYNDEIIDKILEELS